MASKSNNNWEQQILNQVSERRRKTYLGKNHPSLKPHEHPNYHVYEITANQALDGDKRDLIAGPEWAIMLQSSLLKAGHDMLGRRLGYNFTFEDWFKDWQDGFKWGINRTGSKNLKTNYPYRTTADTDGWREDSDSKPQYLEWKNPNPKSNPNYRVIEYFPQGEGESVVFVGSDMMIVQQIINWEWQKSGGGSVERSQRETGFTSFKGQPKVNLWFVQPIEERDPNYKPVKALLSFRIIGKTERGDLVEQGKTSLEKLTTTEVEQIASRIITNFAQPQPYQWYKGKGCISYRDKAKGIESWNYVSGKSEGVELYTKLLTVAGQGLDRTKLRYTEVDDAAAAYPTDPPNMKVLGQTMKGIRKRPYTPVEFAYATLSLESLSYDIKLTNDSIVVFDSEKFAEAAERP